MTKRKRRQKEVLDGDQAEEKEEELLDLAPLQRDPHVEQTEKSQSLEVLFKKRKLKTTKRNLTNQEKIVRQEEELTSIKQRKNTATSLDGLLRQALKSGDRKLLDTVISNIDLLVSKLPPELIQEYLEQLVDRIQTTSLRMREAGPWIREILRQHTGFCSSVQSIREVGYSIETFALGFEKDISSCRLQTELDSICYTGLRRLDETARKNFTFVIQSDCAKNLLTSAEPLLKFKEGADPAHEMDVLLPTSTKGLKSSDIEGDEIIDTTDTEG